ncbi:hypothetical protein OCU04_006751 [Sclerotinia nivalis]|uniref:Uncharacterized protein n=1 Tax=Sclerotinia nivalis TaxID=352851 RepID=A0A9X0AKD5_9HELO|nr:hypothetical protein OCU04_006751 [Sclerotinia nivalis]
MALDVMMAKILEVERQVTDRECKMMAAQLGKDFDEVFLRRVQLATSDQGHDFLLQLLVYFLAVHLGFLVHGGLSSVILANTKV